MILFSGSDLDALLDPDSGFGVQATYNSGTINVILRENYEKVLEEGVITSVLAVIVKKTDVTGIVQNATFVIDSVTYYYIGRLETNDGGVLTLEVSKDQAIG